MACGMLSSRNSTAVSPCIRVESVISLTYIHITWFRYKFPAGGRYDEPTAMLSTSSGRHRERE